MTLSTATSRLVVHPVFFVHGDDFALVTCHWHGREVDQYFRNAWEVNVKILECPTSEGDHLEPHSHMVRQRNRVRCSKRAAVLVSKNLRDKDRPVNTLRLGVTPY